MTKDDQPLTFGMSNLMLRLDLVTLDWLRLILLHPACYPYNMHLGSTAHHPNYLPSFVEVGYRQRLQQVGSAASLINDHNMPRVKEN